MNKTLYKILLVCIKYTPIVTALILIIHIIIKIAGYEDKILDHLVRMNPVSTLFMIVTSFILRFCWIHRVFIIYNFIVSFEMVYNEEYGFTHTLLFHQVNAVFLGITVYLLLICHFKCFVNNNKVFINNKISI